MTTLRDHLPYAIRQFEVDVLVPLSLFGLDVSITSAAAAKFTTVFLIVTYMIYAMRQRAILPGRRGIWRSRAEGIRVCGDSIFSVGRRAQHARQARAQSARVAGQDTLFTVLSERMAVSISALLTWELD